MLYVLYKFIVYSFSAACLSLLSDTQFFKHFSFVDIVLFHCFSEVLYLVSKFTVFAACLSLFVGIM